jgi:hypothetical protein
MCKVKLKDMGFPKIKALEVELRTCSILIKPTPRPLHHVKNHHKFFIFQNFPCDTQKITIQWALLKRKAQENLVMDFMKSIKLGKKWLWTLQKT